MNKSDNKFTVRKIIEDIQFLDYTYIDFDLNPSKVILRYQSDLLSDYLNNIEKTDNNTFKQILLNININTNIKASKETETSNYLINYDINDRREDFKYIDTNKTNSDNPHKRNTEQLIKLAGAELKQILMQILSEYGNL